MIAEPSLNETVIYTHPSKSLDTQPVTVGLQDSHGINTYPHRADIGGIKWPPHHAKTGKLSTTRPRAGTKIEPRANRAENRYSRGGASILAIPPLSI